MTNEEITNLQQQLNDLSDRLSALESAPRRTPPTDDVPMEELEQYADLEELDDSEEEEENWLWEPFIAFGTVSLILGDGGAGKSTLALTLAGLASQGLQPPPMINKRLLSASDSPTMEPARVICLTEENLKKRKKRPFLRAGGDRHNFFYSREENYHLKLTQNTLDYLYRTKHPKVIIVDPIQQFLPPGVHMTDQLQMRNLCGMLSRFAAKTGTAIILTGHLNKNEGAKDVYRGMGSTELINAARSVMALYKVPPDPYKSTPERVFLEITKTNLDADTHVPIQVARDEDKRISFINPSDVNDDSDVSVFDYVKELTQVEKAHYFLTGLLADGEMPVSEIYEAGARAGILDRNLRRAATSDFIEQRQEGRVHYWRLA